MKIAIIQYGAFLVPFGLWGVTTQLGQGQLVPDVDCDRNTALTLFACILAVIVSLSAVGAGAMALRHRGVPLGTLCWCGGLLFSFAVLLREQQLC
ncbi:hypothetical protein HNQ72_004453 [Rhizobium wenxiniae]|uniref:Uncharacterized protein n=1 Tax=Rhizobium wenxiniae TaxID=1737357 RepID=A0A7X0D204_9HYPH|nr:hypothetical protein [Rhizobium wenxiniae]